MNRRPRMDFHERLQAALASSYRLERELGGGGMSRVFVATETALGRRVVIKVLPPELAAGLSVERFRREIQLAASLQHPHIVPLLAAGPAADMLYYTMPLIEGESLRGKIAREGELPIGETVRILRDVVDALACAHEHDIVHRDIKPDNVLVSRHHGMVADFGVAKALSEATGPSSVTSTGMALGTPAYMAPEQATADPHVDHRADIYAVGALAYEMLSGRPPFTGSSPQAVLAAQVTQRPDPVTRYRASVPPALSTMVMRCLEKSPADRYQSADELLHLLEAMATPSGGTAPTEARTAADKPISARLRAVARHRSVYLVLGALTVLGLAWSFTRHRGGRAADPLPTTARAVVVLPFENLGRPEDEYFADGVTEEITNRLTSIGGLRVISRNSARQYKGTQKPLKQIGEELGVSYALVGTVRWGKAGDSTQVRVSPELIRVSDGTNVWAHAYDAVVAGMFRVQSDIAEEVAGALNVALAEPERQALAAKPTDNPQAYDYYLRGKQYYERGYAEGPLRLAEDLFGKALAADPNFALAWAALSGVHDELYWFFYDRSEKRLAQQKEAAERALSLQPNLPEGHVALGYYHYHGRLDYEVALREFELALQLRPNDSEVYQAIGLVQRRQGKWREAFENQKRAVELDPRSLTNRTEAASTALALKDFTQAEHYFAEAATLAPDEPGGYAGLADVALARGDREKFREVLRTGLERVGPERFIPVPSGPGALPGLLQLLDDGHSAELHRIGVSAFGSDKFIYYLTKAELHYHERRVPLARAYADSARVLLEGRLGIHPEDGPLHSFLSWAYALQGRREEAIREGKAAEQIYPLSRDALGGQAVIWFLARIYVLVNEPDSAVAQLQVLLSIPSVITKPWLRIDPVWAPLRSNPRFQALIAEDRPAG
jgi:eukaryotic-like serine/threonine-protein kinase